MRLTKPFVSLQPALAIQGKRVKTLGAWLMSRNRMTVVVVGMTVAWLLLSWMVLHLERGATGAMIDTYPKALWWGIVTVLTVGYGDLTPVTAPGRSAAGLLMIVGVCAMAIITAKISAGFLKEVLMEGRGSIDRSRVKGHVVICGWKEDFADFLRHVLASNGNLTDSMLVVIADKRPEDVQALRSDPRLGRVVFILGPYYQQATLERAAPDSASKILILSDTTPGPDGHSPTDTEADARTIMTAIALGSIAKGTVVAAEILDPANDQYLRLAGVGEIIYTRKYSRLLLGSTAGGTGLANVFHDLLDPEHAAGILLTEIPEPAQDRPYADLRNEMARRHPDRLLLGILENTGNPHAIKELALREAQKTPNIERLIANLKDVKTLRCNHPVFNPDDGYRVKRGSLAITLTKSGAAAATARIPTAA